MPSSKNYIQVTYPIAEVWTDHILSDKEYEAIANKRLAALIASSRESCSFEKIAAKIYNDAFNTNAIKP